MVSAVALFPSLLYPLRAAWCSTEGRPALPLGSPARIPHPPLPAPPRSPPRLLVSARCARPTPRCLISGPAHLAPPSARRWPRPRGSL
eukprot:4604455-Pleurochrysis_carterae.AAC.1